MVEDETDVRDIEAARGDVGRDHHLERALSTAHPRARRCVRVRALARGRGRGRCQSRCRCRWHGHARGRGRVAA
eukprot:5249586-Pleurochrysis_carterae.AAC.1